MQLNTKLYKPNPKLELSVAALPSRQASEAFTPATTPMLMRAVWPALAQEPGSLSAGINKKQEAAQLADRLREIGTDAEAELIPTTIQLDRETLRLTGTVEQQYTELRKILDRLYRSEFGLDSETQAQTSNIDP